MAKVRLLCISHRKRCEGVPGDIIDVSHEDAEWLISRKAAIPHKEQTVRTAMVEPQENASIRIETTNQPARGRKRGK